MSLEVQQQQQQQTNPYFIPHPQHQHVLPSTTCELHPNEPVTGFCASCLRERLQGLEASAIANPSHARKSTSALKSVLFKLSSSTTTTGPQPPLQHPFPSSSSSQLRRCKSFSFARCAPGASFEPQRRSCDVRTTLWSLFNQDNDHLNTGTVPEISVELEDEIVPAAVEPVVVVGTSGEIEEALPEISENSSNSKPMKEYIDVESQQQGKKGNSKDLKEIAGSFWVAASVFSKKLQKWRRKQKEKKEGSRSKAAAAAMPVEKGRKLSRRRYWDSQSEVAGDAFGRRSCDTDPRFSLDAGRFSFDDPMYSLDEPRASWDGYLTGGRSVFPRLPPMLSVVEDAPTEVVERSDGLIPVEEDGVVPGGSLQTRDYYLDSSSRRRRSLDRSSSIREQPGEFNEIRPVCNGKVAPGGGGEIFHFQNGGFVDRDSRDWSSNSLRDDYFGSIESGFEDPFKGGDRKKSRWSKALNIWGFLQRRTTSRNANVVDRSFSESWTELQSRGFSGKISRSNSSVSHRNSFSSSTGNGSFRSQLGTNGHTKKINKRSGEFVLDRTRSARYSPNKKDNSMLRFYLPPMGNSRRNGISSNGRQISSNYLNKSMLGLY